MAKDWVDRLAVELSPGARRALLLLTDDPQLPSRDGIQAAGAWALHVFGQRHRKPLCSYGFDRRVLRHTYQITPFGKAVASCIRDHTNV